MADKIPFIRLREMYHFDAPSLAQKADVEPVYVYAMLNDRPVYRYEVEKVLQALSEMTGQQYTLENVDVKLKD